MFWVTEVDREGMWAAEILVSYLFSGFVFAVSEVSAVRGHNYDLGVNDKGKYRPGRRDHRGATGMFFPQLLLWSAPDIEQDPGLNPGGMYDKAGSSSSRAFPE